MPATFGQERGDRVKMPHSGRVLVGVLACIALVAAGLILLLTAPDNAANFGWYAYEPMTENLPIAWFPVGLYGQRLVAAGVLSVAFIVAAMELGFHWGRGVGRAEARPGPDPFSPPTPQ